MRNSFLWFTALVVIVGAVLFWRSGEQGAESLVDSIGQPSLEGGQPGLDGNSLLSPDRDEERQTTIGDAGVEGLTLSDLMVTVVDLKGNPIPGAKVTAALDGKSEATAEADGDGIASLVLPPTNSKYAYVIASAEPIPLKGPVWAAQE